MSMIHRSPYGILFRTGWNVATPCLIFEVCLGFQHYLHTTRDSKELCVHNQCKLSHSDQVYPISELLAELSAEWNGGLTIFSYQNQFMIFHLCSLYRWLCKKTMQIIYVMKSQVQCDTDYLSNEILIGEVVHWLIVEIIQTWHYKTI